MPSARRTIVINRPIETVFAFFTTPSNDPRWRRHVKEIDGHADLHTGSRIHQVITGPGGRGIAADIEVTDYSSPTHYAFQVVAGPARPRGEYAFKSVGAEATEVTFSLAADLSGLKKLFMSGPVQKSMDGEVSSLDTAKGLIESV